MAFMPQLYKIIFSIKMTRMNLYQSYYINAFSGITWGVDLVSCLGKVIFCKSLATHLPLITVIKFIEVDR